MGDVAVHRRRPATIVGTIAVAALIAALTLPWVGAEAHRGGGHGHGDDGGKLLFFASDGLRQDAVEKYSDEKATPGFRELLRKGSYASGHGLLTQAPPNTGAGWFTLATGAWPAVHGSTNNTFHINGGTFANSTSALPTSGSILQAETLAQSTERGGKKVAQIEWAGGRGALDRRADARLPAVPLGPRRGDELHLARRLGAVRPGLRPAVRPSRRLRGPRALRRRRAGRRDRLDRRAALVTAPRRRCGCGARRHRRQADSTASTRTSTTAATTGRRGTTACSSAARRTARTRSAT